jgi:hypothetical protein
MSEQNRGPHRQPPKNPVRNPEIAWRSYGEKTVILQLGGPQPDARQFHELDELGSLIWSLSDGTRDIQSIGRSVEAAYEVPLDEATRDAAEFLGELADRGLILWNSETPSL